MAYTNLSSLFTAIADAIRGKTGKTAEIVAQNFPEEINSIIKGSGNATPDQVLEGRTFANSEGANTGTMPNNGSQVSTITTKDQAVTIKNGFHDGNGTVSIDADEQAKIIGDNIIEGTSILGVTGTCKPASGVKIEPTKKVTPYTTAQTIAPSSGYDVMAEIVVEAIAYSEVENSVGGMTVTIGTVNPA